MNEPTTRRITVGAPAPLGAPSTDSEGSRDEAEVLPLEPAEAPPKRQKPRAVSRLPQRNLSLKLPSPMRSGTPKPKLPSLKRPGVLISTNLLAATILIVLLVPTFTRLQGATRVGVVLLLLMGLAALFMQKFGDKVLPVRYVPSEPLPKLGLRGLVWRTVGNRLYARFGWRRLTKLSVRERIVNADKSLREIGNTQGLVAFCNSKGGSGKTTIACWQSVLFADVIKRPIHIQDVNDSPGTTALRLGIEPKNRMRSYLDQVLASKGEMPFDEFNKLVDWHEEAAVSVVASERAGAKGFTLETFTKGLDNAKKNSHAVFCDCGTAIFSHGNLGSVLKADRLVFVGNVRMSGSLEHLHDTIDDYADYEKGLLADKVKQGVLIFVGTDPKKRAKLARKYGYPIERVFVVPRNRYMEAAGDEDIERSRKFKKPVRLHKIPPKIEATLKEALVAIFKEGDAGVTNTS